MCGTGKKRYETPVDAMLALDRIQQKRGDAVRLERTYYDCWSCGGYHLTSWLTSEG